MPLRNSSALTMDPIHNVNCVMPMTNATIRGYNNELSKWKCIQNYSNDIPTWFMSLTRSATPSPTIIKFGAITWHVIVWIASQKDNPTQGVVHRPGVLDNTKDADGKSSATSPGVPHNASSKQTSEAAAGSP